MSLKPTTEEMIRDICKWAGSVSWAGGVPNVQPICDRLREADRMEARIKKLESEKQKLREWAEGQGGLGMRFISPLWVKEKMGDLEKEGQG